MYFFPLYLSLTPPIPTPTPTLIYYHSVVFYGYKSPTTNQPPPKTHQLTYQHLNNQPQQPITNHQPPYHTGEFAFGSFDSFRGYRTYELISFLIMGGVGGLMGALFNDINRRVTMMRKRRIAHR